MGFAILGRTKKLLYIFFKKSIYCWLVFTLNKYFDIAKPSTFKYQALKKHQQAHCLLIFL